MDRARAAHLLRATVVIVGGGLALIAAEIGAAWLVARVYQPPVTPGVPEGAITGAVIGWIFIVGIISRVIALGCLGLAMASVAERVGYRARDGLLAFVPLYGIVIAVRFAWRATEIAPRTRTAPAARDHLSFA